MPNKFDFAQVSEHEHQHERIFISYSRKDSQYVDGFRSHLSALNSKRKRIDWYIDRKNLKLNELWRDRITLEIMKARVFVFFMSSDAFESEFVKEELDMAIKRKRLCHCALFDSRLPMEKFKNNSIYGLSDRWQQE